MSLVRRYPVAAALVSLAIGLSSLPAGALSLAKGAEPQEVPPAAYTGDVYVDSRGCAYARVDVGNSVNWVPRLTADRSEVVCGLTPTFGARKTITVAMDPTPSAPTRAVAPAPEPAAPGPITMTLRGTCPDSGRAARMRVGDETVPMACTKGMSTEVTTIETLSDGARVRVISVPPATTALAAVSEPVAAPVAPATPAMPAPTTAFPRVVIGGTGAIPPATFPAPPRADTDSGATTTIATTTATIDVPVTFAPGNSPRVMIGTIGAAPAPSAPATATILPSPAAGGEPVTVACPVAGKARVRIGEQSVPVQCAPDQLGDASYYVQHPNGSRTQVVIHAAGSEISRSFAAAAPAQQDAQVLIRQAVPAPVIPAGYRAAWTDDRLNPCRGPRDMWSAACPL